MIEFLVDGFRRVRNGSPFLEQPDSHRRWVAARMVADGTFDTMHTSAVLLPAARANHAAAEGHERSVF
jgi:hypothetical protein